MDRPQPLPPLFSPAVDAAFASVHDAAAFLVRFVAAVFRRPFHVQELVRQCYMVGYRSLALITLSGFVIGVVFTKQSRPSLAEFGATSWLPSLITVALVRSLAPLVTALISAGKVGSGIGAELGSMKVTEQIEAMEVSATNPFKFLVVTRTLATLTMMPVLTIYCCAVGLVGSWLNVRANEGTTFEGFLRSGFDTISFLDVGAAIVKSLVFGFTIGIISCYQGFRASRGTRGVGRAANASVVLITVALFVEEVLMVQIIGWIRGG